MNKMRSSLSEFIQLNWIKGLKRPKPTLSYVTGTDKRRRDGLWKIPRKFWLTKQMVTTIDDPEVRIRVVLSELLMFGIFLIILLFIAFDIASPSMYHAGRIIQTQFLISKFIANETEFIEKTFDDVTSIPEIWMYLNKVLFDGECWDKWYNRSLDDNTILKIPYENVLLGTIRLRQVRVTNNSCEIPAVMRNRFNNCYGRFTTENEDTTTIETISNHADNVIVFDNRNARRLFLPPTAPPESSLPNYWSWSISDNDSTETFAGMYATYGVGGFIQDLTKNERLNRDLLQHLEENVWLTRGTRVLMIEFTVYNLNLNLFSVVKLAFEIPAVGGITPNWRIRTVNLTRYLSEWDHVIMALEIVFLLFVLYFILEEIYEVLFFRLEYFMIGWNYVDLIIIFFAVRAIFYLVNINITMPVRMRNVINHPDIYTSFQDVGYWQHEYKHCAAIILFFSFLKLVKYSSYHGNIRTAVKHSQQHLIEFTIMFNVIFLGFVQLGYHLFGSYIRQFSAIEHSILSLIRIILGDFDLDALLNDDPFVGQVFFLVYIAVVLFLLLNLFLSIIADNYAMEAESISVTRGVTSHAFIKRAFRNCCLFCNPFRKRGKRFNVVHEIEKVKTLLRCCSFTEPEIDMFLELYEVVAQNVDNVDDIYPILLELWSEGFQARTLDVPRKVVSSSSLESTLPSSDLMMPPGHLRELFIKRSSQERSPTPTSYSSSFELGHSSTYPINVNQPYIRSKVEVTNEKIPIHRSSVSKDWTRQLSYQDSLNEPVASTMPSSSKRYMDSDSASGTWTEQISYKDSLNESRISSSDQSKSIVPSSCNPCEGIRNSDSHLNPFYQFLRNKRKSKKSKNNPPRQSGGQDREIGRISTGKRVTPNVQNQASGNKAPIRVLSRPFNPPEASPLAHFKNSVSTSNQAQVNSNDATSSKETEGWSEIVHPVKSPSKHASVRPIHENTENVGSLNDCPNRIPEISKPTVNPMGKQSRFPSFINYCRNTLLRKTNKRYQCPDTELPSYPKSHPHTIRRFNPPRKQFYESKKKAGEEETIEHSSLEIPAPTRQIAPKSKPVNKIDINSSSTISKSRLGTETTCIDNSSLILSKNTSDFEILLTNNIPTSSTTALTTPTESPVIRRWCNYSAQKIETNLSQHTSRSSQQSTRSIKTSSEIGTPNWVEHRKNIENFLPFYADFFQNTRTLPNNNNSINSIDDPLTSNSSATEFVTSPLWIKYQLLTAETSHNTNPPLSLQTAICLWSPSIESVTESGNSFQTTEILPNVVCRGNVPFQTQKNHITSGISNKLIKKSVNLKKRHFNKSKHYNRKSREPQKIDSFMNLKQSFLSKKKLEIETITNYINKRRKQIMESKLKEQSSTREWNEMKPCVPSRRFSDFDNNTTITNDKDLVTQEKVPNVTHNKPASGHANDEQRDKTSSQTKQVTTNKQLKDKHTLGLITQPNSTGNISKQDLQNKEGLLKPVENTSNSVFTDDTVKTVIKVHKCNQVDEPNCSSSKKYVFLKIPINATNNNNKGIQIEEYRDEYAKPKITQPPFTPIRTKKEIQNIEPQQSSNTEIKLQPVTKRMGNITAELTQNDCFDSVYMDAKLNRVDSKSKKIGRNSSNHFRNIDRVFDEIASDENLQSECVNWVPMVSNVEKIDSKSIKGYKTSSTYFRNRENILQLIRSKQKKREWYDLECMDSEAERKDSESTKIGKTSSITQQKNKEWYDLEAMDSESKTKDYISTKTGKMGTVTRQGEREWYDLESMNAEPKGKNYKSTKPGKTSRISQHAEKVTFKANKTYKTNRMYCPNQGSVFGEIISQQNKRELYDLEHSKGENKVSELPKSYNTCSLYFSNQESIFNQTRSQQKMWEWYDLESINSDAEKEVSTYTNSCNTNRIYSPDQENIFEEIRFHQMKTEWFDLESDDVKVDEASSKSLSVIKHSQYHPSNESSFILESSESSGSKISNAPQKHTKTELLRIGNTTVNSDKIKTAPQEQHTTSSNDFGGYFCPPNSPSVSFHLRIRGKQNIGNIEFESLRTSTISEVVSPFGDDSYTTSTGEILGNMKSLLSSQEQSFLIMGTNFSSTSHSRIQFNDSSQNIITADSSVFGSEVFEDVVDDSNEISNSSSIEQDLQQSKSTSRAYPNIKDILLKHTFKISPPHTKSPSKLKIINPRPHLSTFTDKDRKFQEQSLKYKLESIKCLITNKILSKQRLSSQKLNRKFQKVVTDQISNSNRVVLNEKVDIEGKNNELPTILDSTSPALEQHETDINFLTNPFNRNSSSEVITKQEHVVHLIKIKSVAHSVHDVATSIGTTSQATSMASTEFNFDNNSFSYNTSNRPDITDELSNIENAETYDSSINVSDTSLLHLTNDNNHESYNLFDERITHSIKDVASTSRGKIFTSLFNIKVLRSTFHSSTKMFRSNSQIRNEDTQIGNAMRKVHSRIISSFQKLIKKKKSKSETTAVDKSSSVDLQKELSREDDGKDKAQCFEFNSKSYKHEAGSSKKEVSWKSLVQKQKVQTMQIENSINFRPRTTNINGPKADVVVHEERLKTVPIKKTQACKGKKSVSFSSILKHSCPSKTGYSVNEPSNLSPVLHQVSENTTDDASELKYLRPIEVYAAPKQKIYYKDWKYGFVEDSTPESPAINTSPFEAKTIDAPTTHTKPVQIKIGTYYRKDFLYAKEHFLKSVPKDKVVESTSYDSENISTPNLSRLQMKERLKHRKIPPPRKFILCDKCTKLNVKYDQLNKLAIFFKRCAFCNELLSHMKEIDWKKYERINNRMSNLQVLLDEMNNTVLNICKRLEGLDQIARTKRPTNIRR